MYSTEIDCLTNGAPHAREAKNLVDFFASLGKSSRYDFVRCYATFDLYNKMRKLRERPFEIAKFQECLRDCLAMAEQMVKNTSAYGDFLTAPDHLGGVDLSAEEAEAQTKFLYGSLFNDFDEDDYYEKTFTLLRERFKSNDVEIARIQEKIALDAGCGGGRFSLALRRMGFREVRGIDFSAINIATAMRRRDDRAIDGVQFQVASVLEIPFPDDTFDFAFSNGVLHCITRPMVEGLSELYRVLKRKGELHVAVMEKPGGILSDTIEILRAVMRNVSVDKALPIVQAMGLKGFRLYSLLDHLLVPVNVRTTPQEFEEFIRMAGFTDLRRFARGAHTDQIELIARFGSADPDAVWKYGVGENKYLCTK